MKSENTIAESSQQFNTMESSGIQLTLNKKILRAMGLWFPRKVKASEYRLYWYFSCFMTLGLVAHISTEIVAIYVYSYDIKIVMNIICTMISGFGATLKAFYAIYMKYEIQDLVGELEGSRFAYIHQRGDGQQKIIRKASRMSRFITAFFEIFCIFMVTLWMVAPLLFEDPTSPLEQPLPLPACFPWDLENPAGYGAAYVFQIITCYTTTSVIAGVDTLCVSMMIHVGGQLKSLAFTLENLVETVNKEFQNLHVHNKMFSEGLQAEDVKPAFKRSEKSVVTSEEKKSSIKLHDAQKEDFKDTEGVAPLRGNEFSRRKSDDLLQEFTEMETAAYHKLTECIKHHESTISFAEEVQKLFSPVILFQCGSSTLILCFVAILLTESSNDLGLLIKCIAYLLFGTFELGLYCVFGDDVMELSGRIAEAAYNSNWTRTSTRFKKGLGMMIMRAQRPIIFKGGFLYVVSMETFASLINASYSYFTILRQAKDKK